MQRLRHVYVWSLLLLVLTHATLAEVAGSNQAGFDKFIRYTKTPGKLETSVVSFQNSRGQIIDLIAAVDSVRKSSQSELSSRVFGRLKLSVLFEYLSLV